MYSIDLRADSYTLFGLSYYCACAALSFTFNFTVFDRRCLDLYLYTHGVHKNTYDDNQQAHHDGRWRITKQVSLAVR